MKCWFHCNPYSPDLDLDVAVTTNVKTEDDNASKTSERANVKLYVVVACIAALVLVAIIQASCTIFKMSRRGSSVQKVRGIKLPRLGEKCGAVGECLNMISWILNCRPMIKVWVTWPCQPTHRELHPDTRHTFVH